MATLTETAFQTRRAVNYTIIGIISYIILRILWAILMYLLMLLFPPKPPPPNYAFGKLPALVFPSPAIKPPGQLTFQLETIGKRLPEASSSTPVYLITKKPSNLLSLPKTQEFAQKLSLNQNPIQETKNLYRFIDDTEPYRTLRYDIVTNNFILRYKFEENAAVFSEKNLPNPQTAVLEAQNLLSSYGLLPPDLENGTGTVTYLKFQTNSLVKTTSLSQADAVRVDLFRNAIKTLRVVTPNPNEGQVTIIYSGSGDLKKRMLEFAYTYWQVDSENVATYAVKTGIEAWSELQNGSGAIIQYPITGTEVVVRNVYMALYDSFEEQTYLQPVYVFEGDNGFVGYVHAITSSWVDTTTPTPTKGMN